MPILTDYQNRPVNLTDERRQHILLHAEMASMESEIVHTLKSPQQVMRSRSDPEVELSYRFYRRTIIGDKWLCVVVKYGSGDAFILTAHLTDRIKKGDQLWPKP